MSKEKLESIVYAGRQTGMLHENTVERLCEMLKEDPTVRSETIRRNEYLRPSRKNTAGRYPDISAETRFGSVIFEVQVSPIFLYRITEREAFYQKEGKRLIWVTPIATRDVFPAWLWDLCASQEAVICDLPADDENLTDSKSGFRLRSFSYSGIKRAYDQQIVGLEELLSIPSGDSAAAFKTKFLRSDYEGRVSLALELLRQLEISEDFQREFLGWSGHDTEKLISWLVSLEYGAPLSGSPNLNHMMNAAFDSEFGKRCFALLTAAIRYFRPELLDNEKTQEKFERAKAELKANPVKQLDRHSPAGPIRSYLFPDWRL